MLLLKRLECSFQWQLRGGTDSNLRIEDTSPGAFRLFVQWLYSQKLVLCQLADTDELEVMDVDAAAEDMNLAELCVLADKLAIPKL